MSTPLDDPHPHLPTSYRAGLRPMAAYQDDDGDGGGPSRPKISPKLILRAFRRHWWQILLLWAVGSGVGIFMAKTRIKPTYEAVGRVRVEPGEQSLYTVRNSGATLDYTEFKEMQANSVLTPVVIGLALTEHPELYRYPRLQGASDVEQTIRGCVRVNILPKQSFIEISMTSTVANECADIVNAVLDAYVKSVSNMTDEETKQRIEQLRKEIDKRKVELDQKRVEWKNLSDQIGAADIDGLKDKNSVTSDDYRQLSDQLAKVEMERVSAQAELEFLRGEKLDPARPADGEALKAAVEDSIESHPKMASIQAEIERVKLQMEHMRRKTANKMDLAYQHQARNLATLRKQEASLKAKLRPQIERDLSSGIGIGDKEQERVLAQAEREFVTLSKQEEHLKTQLGNMKLRSRQAGTESLQLSIAQYDAERAASVLHKVEDNLNQLEHEARNPIARVRREFPAKAVGPNGGNRTKMIMMTPPGVFLIALALFVLLESRAGRVADPDDLPSRAKLQVLGVVPPLPVVRAVGLPGSREEDRAQRLLDEFVQSLDHLRVTLCARPDPWGRNRHCFLITSACGSEGKTTLAAQLAERCVNAGLMTLLIDADLRNPTLTRMLDSTESEGLINVLRGEVEAEQVIKVIDAAGGFHFLPAGSPRIDPSRLLQGNGLGSLLAQARESFDMILVDASPVLPVPDALMIGRWMDGAVLAVRYDNSRFNAVERAQRRLTSVGVPVIGAVVNGVKSSESSSYGGYYAYVGGGAANGSPDPEA
ncbi:polysaccharide biosynthesis tyrosine autokinase [Singulisphaera sp. PoT]|uniref:polysaccharide biosynthesis tyrosine autokinase n=1 Tax=Singulisphaera sp. PoT TaxID=3411797 RepID=UPI003BF493F0